MIYKGNKIHMSTYKHEEYSSIKASTKIAMNLILESLVSNGWKEYFGCNISNMCVETSNVIVWCLARYHSHSLKCWSSQIYLGFT